MKSLENTCRIPERFCGGDSLRKGAISSVCTFTFNRSTHSSAATGSGLDGVGTDEVTPAVVVCDLGIYIHADVPERSHATVTASVCFTVLRSISVRVGRERMGTPFPFFFYTTGTSLRWPYDMRPSVRAEKYIRDAGP